MEVKKTLDKAIKVCDADITKQNLKDIYVMLGKAVLDIENTKKVKDLINRAQVELIMLMKYAK